MGAAYAPRRIAYLDLWAVEDVRLKAYGITLDGDSALDPELVVAARDGVAATVPAAAAAEGEDTGLGFVVVHVGTEGVWLLMHWWAHDDICCQRLGHAKAGSTQFRSVSDRPLMACVWELVVIDHERRSWVRHMLSDEADPNAYLADRLPDGLY